MTDRVDIRPAEFDIRALVAWYETEFARRTRAVEDGTAALDWIVPEYRVSWSEVVARAETLGWRGSPVDLRIRFHEESAR